MALQNLTKISLRSSVNHEVIGRMAASADDKMYFPHAHVPILEDNPEDEYFEPDGVNDFVRDYGSWDPDRESC
ncbi:MAG: hypothetical protein ABI854_07375 [Betaproteobacteria bacterium]